MPGGRRTSYQQAMAGVTRELDDLAEDRREGDLLWLHPRRIPHGTATTSREARGAGGGATEVVRRGESAGEPAPHSRHEERSGQAAGGVGDDVVDAADASR